jgi:hypothetical protein
MKQQNERDSLRGTPKQTLQLWHGLLFQLCLSVSKQHMNGANGVNHPPCVLLWRGSRPSPSMIAWCWMEQLGVLIEEVFQRLEVPLDVFEKILADVQLL